VETGPLKFPAEQAELLRDPYLEAFIGAKSVEAAERGVTLRIGPETLIRGRITDAQDVTTVIGNLIDNAVRAAVHGSAPDRWVDVELLDELSGDNGTLHLVVADSGDGLGNPGRRYGGRPENGGPEPAVPAEEAIFTDGGSRFRAESIDLDPLAVHGFGFGLPLCRQLARRRGGDVWVASPGRPGGPGAVFCARLPGTVAAKETAGERA
jgi:two-component system CitB family sensor kinase